MTTYVFVDGGLVNKRTGEFEPFKRNAPISMPMIMRGDETEPLQSAADGKWYTSKAAMRESYKASNNPRGIAFEEVGDDSRYLSGEAPDRDMGSKEDVAVAVEKAEAAISRGEFDHIQ